MNCENRMGNHMPEDEIAYSIRITAWTLEYGFGRNVLDPVQHSESGLLCIAGEVLKPALKGVSAFASEFHMVHWDQERKRGGTDLGRAGDLTRDGDTLNGSFIIPVASLPSVTTALAAGVIKYMYLRAPRLRYRKAVVSTYTFLQTAFGEVRPEDLGVRTNQD